MTTRRRRREFSLEFHGPVVWASRVVLLLVWGIPIVWIVLTSLKQSGDVGNPDTLLLFTPTLDAYQTALANGLVPAAAQSFAIAVGTTALTLVLALPAAYGLARIPGRITTIGLGFLVVLQMLPQTATVIPFFQVFGQIGLIDTTVGVIIADTALLMPWAVLIMRPFFRSVPTAVEESAAIDGANGLRTFLQVVLPLVRNGVATTATLIFILAWGEFLYAINLLLSPGRYPLSALLAQQINLYTSNWPGLMALAVITSIPILVLFVFTFRLLRDGLAMGAVK